MEFIRQIEALSSLRRPLALAAGFFDGVHIGHQRLLRAARRLAQEQAGAAWVLTFDPHPLKVLAQESAPPLLTALPHKLRLFADAGMDGCLALPFTESLAACTPEDFIAMVAAHVKSLAAICVGANWTFGRDGRGRPELLRQLAGQYGFRAIVVPPICHRGVPVSSTRVRRAVMDGRLTDAAAMLGRPFSVLGTVILGRGIGRKLGIPTANLATLDEVRPPPGVYAVHAVIGKRILQGVANIGWRPTVAPADAELLLETHLLDFDDDIYGQELEIIFRHRLRAERRFPSLEKLRAQILRDIQRARRRLPRHP